MVSAHCKQHLLNVSIQTGLAGRPLRVRHCLPQIQGKRFSRKNQNRQLCVMSGNSPAKLQDISTRKEALSNMYEKSRTAFPDVQAVTCTELQDMLSSSEPIVLVDVRSPDEQTVSMLPGHVMKKADFDRHPQDYADSKIVTYCTIGVRSGKYAQELINRGIFAKVYNLKGSIVAWSQDGYPLVKGDGSQAPTTTVHTFGKAWDLGQSGACEVYVTFGAGRQMTSALSGFSVVFGSGYPRERPTKQSPSTFAHHFAGVLKHLQRCNEA